MGLEESDGSSALTVTGNHTMSISSSAAEALKSEIRQLMQRHQSETCACINDWIQQQTQVEGMPPVSLQVSPGQVPPSTVDAQAEPYPSEQACQRSRFRALTHDFAVPKQPEVKNSKGTKKTLQNKAQDCLFEDKRQTLLVSRTVLQRITENRMYEWASGTLIILNSVWTGFQTQYLAETARDQANQGMHSEPVVFPVVNAVFCVLFTAELGLRWTSDGLVDFFRSRELPWNVFDVVIVGMSLVDTITDIVLGVVGGDSTLTGNVTIMRVLRVARIVRVARVIRFMRFFRELRMMVYSMLGSLKSLLWVCLVLLMMFYLFGISFTVGTTAFLNSGGESEPLVSAFGSLDVALLTLFMAMSGGENWGVYFHILEVLPVQYQVLYLLYITFSLFAVVNCVTGIFVETAMQSNKKDRDIIIHEELAAKQKYLQLMRDVFDEMDADNTGVISLEEFENSLDDEKVIAYFNFLKLDVSDARLLFQMMDVDRSREVGINEFLTGCYKLQGESRSLDMKLMECEVRFVKDICLEFRDMLIDLADQMQSSARAQRPV